MNSEKVAIIGFFSVFITLIICVTIFELGQAKMAKSMIERGYAANEVHCALKRTDTACGIAALATASK